MSLNNFEGFRGWSTLGKAFMASGWTLMIKPNALKASRVKQIGVVELFLKIHFNSLSEFYLQFVTVEFLGFPWPNYVPV
tara:strand:- start:7 stop:243 length:237 start_codon:yes stop_codon:yes gene_type:complete